MELQFSTRVLDDHVIVRVGGEIDLLTAPVLRGRLLDVMTQRCTHLIADLADVSFMDARGLAVLVLIHRRAWSIEGSFRIAAAGAMIHKELQITGLSRHLALYDSVAAALSAPANGNGTGRLSERRSVTGSA